MLKSHQRGDLTPAETKVDYLRFAKVLYKERNGFKRFGAANEGTLLALCFQPHSRLPDLLFDCSRVLEYAKIRTVLQSTRDETTSSLF